MGLQLRLEPCAGAKLLSAGISLKEFRKLAESNPNVGLMQGEEVDGQILVGGCTALHKNGVKRQKILPGDCVDSFGLHQDLDKRNFAPCPFARCEE